MKRRALRNDAPEYQYEIDAETDRELYGILSKPDAAGVEYIRANFCRVEWNYYDRGMFQLRVEFEEESVVPIKEKATVGVARAIEMIRKTPEC